MKEKLVKIALKIVIGILVIGAVGYCGSILMDKMEAKKLAQPAVVEQTQTAPPALVVNYQAPGPAVIPQQPVQVQQELPKPEPTANSGMSALLQSGQK